MITENEGAHLVLVQPEGRLHALALLDPMLNLANSLQEMGVMVSTGRNRLRRDAVNIIFGAVNGFDPFLTDEYRCVFVNLEQLGVGGSPVRNEYLRLLKDNMTVDYHEGNLAAYGKTVDEVPILTFGFDKSAAPDDLVPLSERPLELLFLGALLPRRMELIRKIRSTGIKVFIPEAPVYGPERDELIRSARAVLNLAAYDVSRFEQVRASLALSLGTPVISERRPATSVGDLAYAPFVSWFDGPNLHEWFCSEYSSVEWEPTAYSQLEAFRDLSTGPSALTMWTRIQDEPWSQLSSPSAQRRVNFVSPDNGYRAGWLNISRSARCSADVLVKTWSDLQAIEVINTESHGEVALGGADEVRAAEWSSAEGAAELVLTAAHVLRVGGHLTLTMRPDIDTGGIKLIIEEPWRTGFPTFRFDLVEAMPVDATGSPASDRDGTALRLTLRKVPSAPAAVTSSRARLDDLGGLLSAPPPPVVLPPSR